MSYMVEPPYNPPPQILYIVHPLYFQPPEMRILVELLYFDPIPLYTVEDTSVYSGTSLFQPPEMRTPLCTNLCGHFNVFQGVQNRVVTHIPSSNRLLYSVTTQFIS